MKALQLLKRHPCEMSIMDVAYPRFRHNHSIIKMVAASLNRVDIYMRDDGRGITHNLPQIMGVDGAGIIHETASDSGFSKGDKVVIYPYLFCGECEFCKKGLEPLCNKAKIFGEHIDGTMCEYICVPNQCLALIPQESDLIEASSLGVAYLTAWGMLVNKAKIKKEQTILIQGAAGGVSYAAMSIAKIFGAKIIVTTTGNEKIKHFIEQNVEVIDYKNQDIASEVNRITNKRGVDIVIDNVGGDCFDISLRCLAKGGTLVTCGATIGAKPPLQIQRLFVKQLNIHGSTMANLTDFHEMIQLFSDKKLIPKIDSIYEMKNFQKAFERLENNERIGKVIIKL